jgi:hypothetical protein
MHEAPGVTDPAGRSVPGEGGVAALPQGLPAEWDAADPRASAVAHRPPEAPARGRTPKTPAPRGVGSERAASSRRIQGRDYLTTFTINPLNS